MKMKNAMNALTLNAATAIHNDINGNEAFCGYEGTTEAFQYLLEEVEVIVDRCVAPYNMNVDYIVELWFEAQNFIAEGILDVDWYLNPEESLVKLALA